MSGLHPRSAIPERDPHIPTPGMIDPTVEIIQPGGPFPYGEAILTDGGGGYTIASTLRPYFVSFRIPAQVGVGAGVDCEHQGVVTKTSGFVTTLATSLIGIAVSVDKGVAAAHTYNVEILRDPAGTPVVVGVLEIDSEDGRTAFTRDLSVGLAAGSELGARVVQTAGTRPSTFSDGLITIEIEG